MLIVENDPGQGRSRPCSGPCGLPGVWRSAGDMVLCPATFCARAEAGLLEVRPRRARCRECAKTHVLLPDLLLCRRVDVIAVIGRALSAAAEGAGRDRTSG